MKAHLKLLAIGGFAFGLFLLARLPASVLFERLDSNQVYASGLGGTIWRGSATSLGIQGLQLGRTSWRFKFLNLLRAEAAIDFNTEIGGDSLTGTAASRGPGKLRLANVAGRIPISELSAFVPAGFFSGTVDVDLEELIISDNSPAEINGKVVVLDVTALTTQPPTTFGDYELLFTDQQQEPLTGILSDLSGSVDLDGQLELRADRSYVLEATLSAKPGASRQINTMLSFVGPQDSQGRRKVSRTGRF